MKSKNPVAVKLKKFALFRYLRSIEDKYIHQPFYKKLEKKMNKKKSKKFDTSLLNKIEKDSKNQDLKNDNKKYSNEDFLTTEISLNNINQFNRLSNKKENKEAINYDY